MLTRVGTPARFAAGFVAAFRSYAGMQPIRLSTCKRG
jgi:hypothetical protein